MSIDKLRGRMGERRITQADLAKLLGLRVCSVNQKLNGRRKFSLDEAKKVADYLEIPDSEFVSFFCK